MLVGLRINTLVFNQTIHVRSERSLHEQIFYGFYPRIYKYSIEPQRFLNLCATRIGQLIDYTQFANELGISRHTIKEWISILKASFIITTLPPYFENLGKRVIKSPKLYFNDVGLACYLLGIRNKEQVAHHPLRGNLFENMIVSEVLKQLLNRGEATPLYFYRDTNQLEVDLIFQWGIELLAIEIKSSMIFNKNFLKGLIKFKNLASMHRPKGYVIYAGDHQQKVNEYEVLNYKSIVNLW